MNNPPVAVHVHAVTIAFTNRALNLLDGSMSGSFWSKPETRFREMRIEDWGQDLLDGLLNQTI